MDLITHGVANSLSCGGRMQRRWGNGEERIQQVVIGGAGGLGRAEHPKPLKLAAYLSCFIFDTSILKEDNFFLLSGGGTKR